MSSMKRKLARGIAKTAMHDEGIKLFKQYAPVDGKVRLNGKVINGQVMRSVFARTWRSYVYEME